MGETTIDMLIVHRPQVFHSLFKEFHVKLSDQNFCTLPFSDLVLNGLDEGLALGLCKGITWLLKLARQRRLIIANLKLDRVMID